MTTHVFLDTAPLLFAVGDPHPDRAGSRHLLAAAQRGELRLHVSAEAVQEFAHHRLRRTTRAEAVAQTRDVLALCDVHAMCTRWGARCSAGGSVPWNRHTTMGTEQISQSAIQQTSSSWNHGVMRAASQRSQSSSNS